jgi:hypothetical protein
VRSYISDRQCGNLRGDENDSAANGLADADRRPVCIPGNSHPEPVSGRAMVALVPYAARWMIGSKRDTTELNISESAYDP